MDSSKINIKFYADAPGLRLANVVPIFHSWIQFHSIPDHLLIDVADYNHVPDGPGVVLVAHEANIYLDRFDGRLGLTYSRKQPLLGRFSDRLRFCFIAALQAAALLDGNSDLNGIKFRTNETNLRINDRLYAPNTPETLAQVKPELEKFLREFYGSDVKVEHRADPRRLFEVQIRANSAPSLEELTSRLNRSAPV
jgi:hypothetical protein